MQRAAGLRHDPEGDLDAYALERSVKIELSRDGAQGIAAID